MMVREKIEHNGRFFETDFIYDVESYPNVFTMTIIHASGKWLKTYEISDRRNDTQEIAKCLRYMIEKKQRMVGFNNIGYDYEIIHMIINILKEAKKLGKQALVLAQELYIKTMHIISSMKDEKFRGGIREENQYIKQVDLYKINHFDNHAKATSLKMLEVNMRSKNVEDLPFPVGKHLADHEIDVLILYNQHDVLETLKFYYYCYEALSLRAELTEQFGFDCTNYNDTKIGKELFIQTLEKESPGICYAMNPGKFGKPVRTIRQTKRKEIVIKDCLLPYISFEREEFKAVQKWFAAQVITETKGVFSDILEHNLGDVAKYAEMITKRIKLNDPEDKKNKRYVPTELHLAKMKEEYPAGWLEEKELKSPKGAKSYYWCYRLAETLNVVIDDFRYDFGVGGIHGAIQGTIHTTEDRVIRTLDVASYYPNLAIANRVFPAHLGEMFCDVYLRLYKQRKATAKGSPANAALKLALNGTYGDSNNEYSPLYDPAYTMTITIGGQLSLCMLMEKLVNECNARIVMCNTDGFEYIVDKDQIEKADSLVKWWEELTGLEMEGDTYSKMFIRDVNNYISVTESGKIKTKGAYEVMHFEKLGWHKNHSAMIIPMAVLDHLMGVKDFEKTIREHTDPFDFMLRTKVPRSSELVMDMGDGTRIPQQNICRYYPSVNGGKLVKIMPPINGGTEDREMGIDTEWTVETCNNMDDFHWEGLNYDYYIQKAKELIDDVSFDAQDVTPF